MKHRKRSIYKLHPIIEYFSISTNLLVFCLAFTKHHRYLKKPKTVHRKTNMVFIWIVKTRKYTLSPIILIG